MPPLSFVPGNRLALLCNGEEYFPALVAAIDAARAEVFLETYLFADDETGSLVAQVLARAAARGVAVHLLLDGFGAQDFAPRFRAILENAGAQVLVFRPNISPWTLKRNRLRRMHRKIAVIDAQVAFVGGINVIDDHDTPGHTPPRYDYAVRVEGPLTAQIRAEAAALWSRVAWVNFRKRWVAPSPPAQTRVWSGEGHRAMLAVRDNVTHRRDIEDAYLALIEAAREEIVIANAYFFPGRRFRQALVAAARAACAWCCCCRGASSTRCSTTPRAPCTVRCSRRVSRSTSITRASCMRKWPCSTAAGRRWVRRTSTHSACCLREKRICSSTTWGSRATCAGRCTRRWRPAPRRSRRRNGGICR